MRLLHLLWPHLPLRLARSRMEIPSGDGTSGSWPSGPIILGGQPWTDGTVVDADPLARALGVRRGIPLGSAHRLAPEATFLDLAPDADRDAVETACERLDLFSPGIAGTSTRRQRDAVGHLRFRQRPAAAPEPEPLSACVRSFVARKKRR